jgi:hypothetical protein
MRSDWRNDLADYFVDRCAGSMGLRSSLGPQLDRKGMPASCTYSVPTGPDEAALRAARMARQVESTLALLDERHTIVLRAYYAPRGPYALDGYRALGDVAPIALVLEEAVETILDNDELELAGIVDRALRGALRTGDAEAREQLELTPLSVKRPMAERLRELAAASDRQRRRLAARTLRRVASVAREALSRAHSAYEEAYRSARAQMREEARQRFRTAVGASG